MTEIRIVNVETPVTFDVEITAEEARQILIKWYPWLANATYTEFVEGDKNVIVFSEAVATKG